MPITIRGKVLSFTTIHKEKLLKTLNRVSTFSFGLVGSSIVSEVSAISFLIFDQFNFDLEMSS